MRAILAALVAGVVVLGSAAPFPSTARAEETSRVPAPVRAAVDHPDRPDGDRTRDADRKPAEVLDFLGIEPGMKVVDLMAGAGYYAEILCRTVGPTGKLWLHNNAFVRNRFKDTMIPTIEARLRQPEMSHCVRLDRELEELGLPDGELDAVTMVLFYHDTYWQKTDRKKMNAEIYRALKPDGIYAVIDHHARAGSGDRDVKTVHRVDADLVREEILAAGFVLEAESDLLRHPEDDRTKNVFDPSIRGKTDRFVYKFRKPSS